MNNSTFLNVCVDKSLQIRIDRMAAAQGRSRSNLIRRLVEQALQTWEQEIQPAISPENQRRDDANDQTHR